MAILPILIMGDPRLRQKVEPVAELSDDDQKLIDDMVETMHAAPGIGLAATQVGAMKRIAVIDLSAGEEPDAVMVLVNPEIHEPEGSMVEQEGCLSIPEVFENIARPERLVLRAQDREGRPYELQAEGLMARAVCHEIDHLDGVLIVDHLSSLKRNLIKKKMAKRAAATA